MSHEETEEAHLLVSSVDDHEVRRKEIILILLKFDKLKVDQKLSVLGYIERLLNEPKN